MTTTNTNEDKLILGGHEFTSRFIMGSENFHWTYESIVLKKQEHRS